MTLAEIAHIRLHNQQIAVSNFNTAKQVVGWMGAMQAQDYYMAQWAVGLRLPGATNITIQAALDKGDILRTHLLRPTWHFVSADDIYWMLALTGPQIKAQMKSRNKELELTDKIFNKSNTVLKKVLTGNKHLTRDELMTALSSAKIKVDENRSSHLLMQAEIEGIICSGAKRGNRLTYALLEERLPKPKSITKDEALARLARRYFISHSPATLKDFIWWSGLNVVDAKHALQMVKAEFNSEEIGSQTYWFTHPSAPINASKSLYLLPAYDEFTISYKDRSASLSLQNHKRSVSVNGIFKPMIIMNGQVIGLWKRSLCKDEVTIEAELFEPTTKTVKKLIEKAALPYGKFLNKKPTIQHSIYPAEQMIVKTITPLR